MTKVSVIIPTYNCARFLPEAIESVLAQTYQDFEIVVVDDGSTDQTEQVVARYQPGVIFIQQENQGPGAARNRGLRTVTGEYIVFLDADDILMPEKLEMQARFLDHHPEVDVVYSNGYYFCTRADGSEKKTLFSKQGFLARGLGDPPESLKILAVQNAFPIHAAMTRTPALLEAGVFDEDIPALCDWDLWYRVAEAHRFAYLDAVLVKYRMMPTGITANRARQKVAAARLAEKIEQSISFAGLTRATQSDFYFCWGIVALEYQDKPMALLRFRRAMELEPRNHLVRFAYHATRILGRRALIFYHLKRILFGARGSRSSVGVMH